MFMMRKIVGAMYQKILIGTSVFSAIGVLVLGYFTLKHLYMMDLVIKDPFALNRRFLASAMIEKQKDEVAKSDMLSARVDNEVDVERAYEKTDKKIEELRIENRRLAKELYELRSAVATDLEKDVSIPMLRRDLEHSNRLSQYKIDLLTKAVDQLYEFIKWFLATVATMMLSTLGLFATPIIKAWNLERGRDKEGGTRERSSAGPTNGEN